LSGQFVRCGRLYYSSPAPQQRKQNVTFDPSHTTTEADTDTGPGQEKAKEKKIMCWNDSKKSAHKDLWWWLRKE
jgi:hypothetical protein